MEDKILKIINKLIIENKFETYYYDKVNINEIELPTKIKKEDFDNIPFNILVDFTKEYFEKFKDTLFENALIYALEYNENNYLKHIKKNEININNISNQEITFMAITCNYAIKNIFNKIINKIDNSKNIKKINPDYFNLLNKYTFISNLYRNITLEILNLLNTKEEKLKVLDVILNREELDHVIIHKLNFLNSENIKTFKSLLKRLILADNYLFFKSFEVDDQLCDENEKYETGFNYHILEYIEECLENNKFLMPKDKDLRHEIYYMFISYNQFIDNKNYDLENLKKEGYALQLIKINPFSYIEE